MSYRATSTTTGRPVMDRKNYVYNGGKPLAGEPASSAPGGAANASRRRARVERFAVILAGLCGDPADATGKDIRKAGELVGVGEKTAREYLKALLRQEESAP